MKKLITNYSFDSALKKITFLDYAAIDQEGILLITNVVDNLIIYNFADAAVGGTVAGNVLTLTYDTAVMSNTDALQIYYDDANVNAATEESLVLLHEQNVLMRRILKTTDSLATVDVQQRQRITLDGGNGSSAVVPVHVRLGDGTSNTMVAPLANGFANSTFWVVPDAWKFIDASRLNFQQAIRSNLQFS